VETELNQQAALTKEAGVEETDGWYLYIVENRFGHWYTGISTDPWRRFQEHASGGKRAAKALKGKGPLQLRYVVSVGSRSRASRLEYHVKGLNRAAKQALVDGHLSLPVE